VVFAPDQPFPKTRGHVVRSKDWNDAVTELLRLDAAKVNKAGDAMTGPLTVAGNVGIGATSPQRPLQIGGDDVVGVGFGTSDASPNAGYVRWGDNTGWKLHFGSSREAPGGVLNTGTAGVLMTLQDNGRVGIGTMTPGTRLHVHNGRLRISESDGAGGSGALELSNGARVNHVFTDGLTGHLHLRTDSADHHVVLQTGGTQGNVGIRTQTPSQAMEVNGGLRVQGPITFPKTTDGDAELANYQGGFLDTSAGTVRLRMGHQPLDAPVPTYGFGVGHSSTFRFFSGIVTAFQTKFSVNQNGDATVAGNLRVSGNLSVGGTKTGYVADNFINGVGDTIEQGDVLVIGSTDASHYSGMDNNIPLIEADLTDTAYDSRVCGIVASVVTENELPYVEETRAPSLEDVAREVDATEAAVRRAVELGVNPFEVEGTGSGGRVLVDDVETAAEDSEASSAGGLDAYLNPLAQFAGEVTPDSDATKIEDQQMGRMVTLGAFAHCKADADIAPISAGDLLTTSPTRGHAQKVLEPEKASGATIGKALASLDKGKGKISVLVMLQ
jgi:hypothetical protein